MHRLILSSLTFVLALGVSPVAPGQNGSAPAPAPFAMGFVDMEKLMRAHPETKAKTDGFQLQLESRTEGLQFQRSKLVKQQAGLELLEPGSPEHLDLLKQIKKIEATLELETKIIRIEFELKVVDALKDVYGRCRTVVKQVAEERGFRAVAMISGSEVQGRTKSELVGDILTRPFIYADKSLDITDAVLARLVTSPKVPLPKKK